MIVVTLTKVPAALRGDLTKWTQEIQTGVYVGNVSARIRDLLWDRIVQNIGHGEATLAYNTNSELGYTFRTTRQDRQVVNYDGVPLMMHLKHPKTPIKPGFSSAAKFHQAKTMAHRRRVQKAVASVVTKAVQTLPPLVVLDLETTGLKSAQDQIMSIGAVKRNANGQVELFQRLIQIERTVPSKITALTGITAEQLQTQGVALATALKDLREFVQDLVIVGYNVGFDEKFLNVGYQLVEQPNLTNTFRDLMPTVKNVQEFLDNYRLPTVLEQYKIQNTNPHHALADAQATLALADKLIKNGDFRI